ncbi:hypothetical protein JS518_14080 [Clostridiales bacterium FE2010]|nr:hypothetical protein JS518_14080 [Clostridiales bacterium FE2010]
MPTTNPYITFNSGLAMDTQYLTENVAYFLGGIYASEEQVITMGTKYRIAPVRYNYNAATDMEITQHFELVREIATPVKGQTVMAENIRGTDLDTGKNRMPGFSTFFRVTTLNELIDLIPSLREALASSQWSVQRAFLVGVFDGRSSADIDKKTYKIRMLSLDCITDEVGAFLSEMLDNCDISYNYNTHRDRLEGGRPRNPQLRVRDVNDFMYRVGLISPRRINIIRSAYEHNYNTVQLQDGSNVLPGLKTIYVR